MLFVDKIQAFCQRMAARFMRWTMSHGTTCVKTSHYEEYYVNGKRVPITPQVRAQFDAAQKRANQAFKRAEEAFARAEKIFDRF